MNICVQIPINNQVGFFMTYNPNSASTISLSSSSTPLANDVRVLFRQINLVRPDMTVVLKAKCSAYGMKAASTLAMRLRLVAELARDQL